MIQQQTILKVSDNSGAKLAKCIKVAKGFNRKTATIGDVITVSIQQLRNKLKKNSKVLKGEIYKGVVIRIKNKLKNKNGISYNYIKNSICLLNRQGKPLATRIIGPIPKQLIKKKFLKLINISGGFV